ncbi:MAG: ferritin family protein [Phycisphaerae bacterium]|jgi:rubrerythrin
MDMQINPAYVLEMAERIERNGVDFYQIAARYVSDARSAQLLLQLAAMEGRHEEIFAEMRRRLGGGPESGEPLDPDSETALYLRGLLAGKFFDIRTTPADYLRPKDTASDILLTAIGLEKETLVFYEGVKQVVRPADRPVVERVLAEEMGHIAQLASVLRL